VTDIGIHSRGFYLNFDCIDVVAIMSVKEKGFPPNKNVVDLLHLMLTINLF
jgi:hypothetical protein